MRIICAWRDRRQEFGRSGTRGRAAENGIRFLAARPRRNRVPTIRLATPPAARIGPAIALVSFAPAHRPVRSPRGTEHVHHEPAGHDRSDAVRAVEAWRDLDYVHADHAVGAGY